MFYVSKFKFHHKENEDIRNNEHNEDNRENRKWMERQNIIFQRKLHIPFVFITLNSLDKCVNKTYYEHNGTTSL
jgi:hypothetical protein